MTSINEPTNDLVPDEVKERRARRIEEVKAALLDMFRRNEPSAPEDLRVEMTPDAAIDFFGMGLLDGDDDKWQELLDAIQNGKPVPVEDNFVEPDTFDCRDEH